MSGGIHRTADPPVTAVISRRARRGKGAELEVLVGRMAEDASRFTGYLGMDAYRREMGEYQVVFRFDRATNLERWMDSEKRRDWNRRIEEVLRDEPEIEVITGLEAWFDGPRAPHRHRMVFVTWMATFPIVTLIFTLFGSYLDLLPVVLKTLILSSAFVPLMAYVVMPRMTRLFSGWLYSYDDEREGRLQ